MTWVATKPQTNNFFKRDLRIQIEKFSFATGGHIGKTGVDIIAVRAFRIVPIEPRGYMTIDAENIDFESSQGQILPGKGRLMVSSADNTGFVND